MGKSAIFSILKALQIPNDSREQHDWRLHKEIALLLQPSAVQVHHDGICGFIGIGNVRHEVRVYWITAMGMFRIIEIYEAEPGLYLAVLVHIGKHVVIGDSREVGAFEVIDICCKSLLYLLFDKTVDYCV